MSRKRTNPGYYAGDLRSDLIAEALSVIETDGPARVSLRALSRRLGVSHAAPKNHFPTKDALFTKIAEDGFVQLHQTLDSALSASDVESNPLDQLERLGLAYLSFAADHPAHFAVMFRGDLVDQTQIVEQASAAYRVLHTATQAAQNHGWRPDTESQTLALLLWSTVHGYAHLEKQGAPTTSDQQQRVRVIRALLHPTRSRATDQRPTATPKSAPT